MEPIIDHIEITVRDMTVAVGFYDKLLPLLGFDLGNRSSARIEQHEKHVVSVRASTAWVRHHLAETGFHGGDDPSQKTRVAPSSCVQSGICGRSRSLAFRSKRDRRHHRECTARVSGIHAGRLLRLLFQRSRRNKVRDRVDWSSLMTCDSATTQRRDALHRDRCPTT